MSQENTKLTTSMSSSSPSPPSSLDGVQVNIYHEKQIGSLCAIHAANNLLGKQQFTEEDFIAIQNELNISATSAHARLHMPGHRETS